MITEAEELCLLGMSELKDMIMQKYLYPTEDRDIMLTQLIQWTDLRIQVMIIFLP